MLQQNIFFLRRKNSSRKRCKIKSTFTRITLDLIIIFKNDIDLGDVQPKFCHLDDDSTYLKLSEDIGLMGHKLPKKGICLRIGHSAVTGWGIAPAVVIAPFTATINAKHLRDHSNLNHSALRLPNITEKNLLKMLVK